ncbi:hemerythrin domain-containing protein [Streptomyces sp. NPDC050535]|uniref:hemerythrin domain-containing protein n=1 Tax=Streptomyces sp. NPDC050535 TaxID=3365626 RepID=UPI00379D7FB6
MADVRDMYMVHTMVRRELRLLPQLFRDVDPGDTARAAVVAEHAELLLVGLHLHHEGEDLILWPLLRERSGAQAEEIVPAMEEQHHGIDEALASVSALLPDWRSTAGNGQELGAACEALLERAVEHMALEEKEILPLAAEHVTDVEWAGLGEHGMGKIPKKDLPLIFGMLMYEADPAVVKVVLSHVPLVARVLLPLVAPRQYAKYAKRVHGTTTPPRIGS